MNFNSYGRLSRADGIGRMIAASASPIVAPLNTANNNLVSVVIPGGSMGPNGVLRLTLWATMTGTANKLLRAQLGGVTLGSNTLTTSALAQMQYEIANRGSEQSQIGQTNSAKSFTEFAAGAVFLTGAVDTSVDQNLIIQLQKTTGADAYTLQRYAVEIIRPAE